MIFRNLSLRAKLILTTLVLIILLTFLALVYLDATRRTASQADLVKARSELTGELLILNTRFQGLLQEGQSRQLGAFQRQVLVVEGALRGVMDHAFVSRNEAAIRKSEQLSTQLLRFGETLRFTGQQDSIRWMQALNDMDLLSTQFREWDLLLSTIQEESHTRRNRQMGISLALGIFLLATYMIFLTLHVGRSFRKLSQYTADLSRGIIPPPLDSSLGGDFNEVAGHLNRHAEDLQKKVGLLTQMSQEGPGEIFTPELTDELGKALVVLSDHLTKKELEEVTRNREDKRQNWISEGMAQLGEVLRSERDDLTELSYLIVQKLVTYMNLEMGSLFITDETDPDHPVLRMETSYAYDRRKYNHMILQWGEGLPGTCAQEGERIFVTDVPEDYFEVASGIGSSRPNCILLVPLLFGQRVLGVIELATVRLLRPFEIEFVESLSESIASSLLAVRNSERSTRLLEQSQAQAEALKAQETAMRENMEKLEQAQEDSRKKESEITGILNAINQSSLVAELALNGRFTSINEQFLMVLEAPRDQVLGKLYSDFAQVDRYADEYKQFWSELKAGKSLSNVEMYKLFTGAEIWLQQTFTPIINNEGKVQKILNIAVDITEKRKLQKELETREMEITRKALDMQTLNQAVNASLIKCELDQEGIIMAVNEIYCEVSGYGRKELLGRNYRLFLKDTEKEQFDKIWEEVIKDKVYEGVIRRSKPTGEEVWLVSTFSPVKDEAGTIYKVYLMGLDITEKKLKYQLLEDANQEIERLRDRLNDYEG
jgi:PAS domain S-box-containing protein